MKDSLLLKKRLQDDDYAVDAVTAAKMLLGKWLCRRLEDGRIIKWRFVTEHP